MNNIFLKSGFLLSSIVSHVFEPNKIIQQLDALNINTSSDEPIYLIFHFDKLIERFVHTFS